jgi:hypothetical protein
MRDRGRRAPAPPDLVARAGAIAGLALLLLVSAAGGEHAGRQGFGTITRAGAGQSAVHVTTLADDGPGSLRAAVSAGDRMVVFDVAGDIALSSAIVVRGAFVTIDGLSAPPPGITLHGHGLIVRGDRGAHDVLIRGLRVRDAADDGVQVAYGASNIVLEHLSVHGSGDGNIDITEGAHDVTVAWSVLAEPQGEGKNMLVKYRVARVSLHHNLLTAPQRNPQVRFDDAGTPGDLLTADIRNNVIADWGPGSGTRIWYGARANVVANAYLSPGSSPSARRKALLLCRGACEAGHPSFAMVYVQRNVSDAGDWDVNAVGNRPQPFEAAPVDTDPPCTAARAVLAAAGVRPLDDIDRRIVGRVRLGPCARH